MVYIVVKPPAQLNLTPQEFHEQQMLWLRQPGCLASRLLEIDKIGTFRRLYIMGCGRSGTWLLTSLFATFSDVDLVPQEFAFELFGLLATAKACLILKRDAVAYRRIEQIPHNIEIIYIVRNPFDVLTSHNLTTKWRYHISPDRWLEEMLALRFLVDTKRKNTTVIRYEDLVGDPQRVQAFLSTGLKMGIKHSVDDIPNIVALPSQAVQAMNGLRKIDQNSVGRYKDDLTKIKYLKAILPSLGQAIFWVGETFNYDITV